MLLLIFIPSTFSCLEFLFFSFYYYLNFDTLIVKLLCFNFCLNGKDLYDYPLLNYTHNKKWVKW